MAVGVAYVSPQRVARQVRRKKTEKQTLEEIVGLLDSPSNPCAIVTREEDPLFFLCIFLFAAMRSAVRVQRAENATQ